MPRDMTATGRYAPQPKHAPFAFYSSVRLGDPGQLAMIVATDPYFLTQDNGAGAPLHFATTYKQLDMVSHEIPTHLITAVRHVHVDVLRHHVSL